MALNPKTSIAARNGAIDSVAARLNVYARRAG